MNFRLTLLFLIFPLLSISQTDTVTLCRFYTYNNEYLFKKLNDKANEITFFIDHSNSDSLDIRLQKLLSMKKGLNNFKISNISNTKLSVILNTSYLFDAHYLRITLDRQLGIQKLALNDNPITWDDFEKMFSESNQ